MTLQIRLFSISCSFIMKNYKDAPQVGVIDKSEIDLRGYVDQGSTGETVHNTRHRHMPSGGPRSTAESYTFIYRTYNTVARRSRDTAHTQNYIQNDRKYHIILYVVFKSRL